MACGMMENICKPQSCVISFHTEDNDVRININYTTRTAGMMMEHAVQGKTQLFRSKSAQQELVKIMKNPQIHAGKGCFTRTGSNHPPDDGMATLDMSILSYPHWCATTSTI
jgi:hypothetical protein